MPTPAGWKAPPVPRLPTPSSATDVDADRSGHAPDAPLAGIPGNRLILDTADRHRAPRSADTLRGPESHPDPASRSRCGTDPRAGRTSPRPPGPPPGEGGGGRGVRDL